ncbi:1,4-alpha-glucan branching enzyme GlgB [bacterium BMS3Abin02]|nr:1,4-alpha-glucan branching enzyme GlgB [bacterium BMS3Abin02]GBE22277.1 1,4-alpha-glucan branching enzyme GlgB [bacterium BMS3Bbin01]HDH26949.1 1,4-alpha-glucan branching protein GlgB [Actinomycetota bacterium]HDK45414.1 1,4-alpha-glucan branching protein GlgB [Actinomycetota bacterium]HDL49951.1 1,4-alpha-glucan branching protein GlgB [Actinomycetota bacterium]
MSAEPGDLTAEDLYLFNEGSHTRLYEKMGAHLVDGGCRFAVWAPDAGHVSVAGDFNDYDETANPLEPQGDSGIWAGFVPGVEKGETYKYLVRNRESGNEVYKADPYAIYAEVPPRSASVVWDLSYDWADGDWMASRAEKNRNDAPIAIYEVHLGSWRRGENGHTLGYREMASELVEYVQELGFTHVEFLPVMEHPFGGSWGYQTTGYFSPTSRFGTPQDFMFLVDALHQAGIGVILDWVPSHFATDEHGLGLFDGTHLYEHADPRQGFHPDWGSYVFNYGRNEVRSFLLSSALFWLDRYHVDGIRVDAVASMLYLDYSRKDGEWIPNEYGGNEDLEAISFLRRFNEEVYGAYPDVQTYAEESTAWPMVSRPTYLGGLGFGFKWDMGWMHDTLTYFSLDPIYRRFHHNELTFRGLYAFSESYVLPLSHDEVVHGKGSLIGKMPGDDWRKFANLRLLFSSMFGQPGKKLLFMGGEIAQWSEWDHDGSVDWSLLEWEPHRGVRSLVADLARLYREETALHEMDCDPAGFEWVEANDPGSSVLAYLRKGPDDMVLVVMNYTPVPRYNYRLGVSRDGVWTEILNSDATVYGGSGMGNFGGIEAHDSPSHGRPFSVNVTVPPLGAVFLKSTGEITP